MINATDAVDLCCKAVKHRKYLQDQVERFQYIDKKINETYNRMAVQCYKNALDHFNSVFELED